MFGLGMTVVLALQVAAQEEHSFAFQGSGWGHAVGMGQWGAYGQALADPSKSGEQIAAHYYPGSQPASISDLDLPNGLLASLDSPLWINLASQVTILEFTPVGGPVELCLADDGEGDCPKPERPQDGERWEFRRISAGECGFFLGGELQGTSGDCRASIGWPDAAGVRLRHGDNRAKPCSVSRGDCEYRHGEIKLRDDPSDLGFHVLLAVGLEDYVRGVAEVLPEWKASGVNEAQAVAARTYAAFKFFAQEREERPADPNGDPGISGSRKDTCWCHLYDNTRDQVYVGWWREDGPEHTAWIDAVESTEGRVLTYFGEGWERFTKGGIIQAFYSASTGGVTTSNRYGFFTEWNGRTPSVVRWPYLEPVEDPWDTDPATGNPHADWRRTISASRLAAILSWDEVTDARLISAPSTTTVSRVRFDGLDDGEEVTTTVAGGWLRYGLSLPSAAIHTIDDQVAVPEEKPIEEMESEDADPEQTPDRMDPPFDELLPFQDIDGHTHEAGIDALRRAGITVGCVENGMDFCPNRAATRLDVAILLARAADLDLARSGDGTVFSDVPAYQPYADHVYALAAAGITRGCTADSFCPDDNLTRAQMASFLARALGLQGADPSSVGGFDDVPAGGVHSDAIYAIAGRGITIGCTSTSFCPERTLSRGAMATLLARAFYWKGPTPPDG